MPDGTYKYQGEFTEKELDFLVEFAVNSLLASGAFPFIVKEEEEPEMVPFPTTDTEQ